LSKLSYYMSYPSFSSITNSDKLHLTFFLLIMFSCSYCILAYSDSSNYILIKTPKEGISSLRGIIVFIPYTCEHGVDLVDVFNAL
jgi:hypothetical protein